MPPTDRPLAVRHTITTKVVRESGQFAVYDEIQYESGTPPTLVCRFRGSASDCEEYAQRLATYWKEKLEAEVDI
jgi:hypothetical protein